MNAIDRVRNYLSRSFAVWTYELRRRRRHMSVRHALAARLRRFLITDDGPTMVEYAVMIALIVAGMVGAIGAVGTTSNTTFAKVVVGVNPEAAEDSGGRGGWCP
jgi:pilus assembly protein Flp/PilA